MTRGLNVDGVLVTWGDRLFYPGNKMVKGSPPPRLQANALRRRAALIRGRILATVVRRAPQVMVKVTGGGRGMRAIAAHFRYISKNGRLEIEDDRGETIRGRQAVRDLAEDWRFSGSLIPECAEGPGRREAFNIMLSMPRGVDPLAVQRAAREFARIELAGHKYVMVLHDHQANPHVHISARAEGRNGKRLNPRKADLQRWRETFAEKLRELGVEAEATRRTVRGQQRQYEDLWRLKAREAGRLRQEARPAPVGSSAMPRSPEVIEAWQRIALALDASAAPGDGRLAQAVSGFIRGALTSQHREPDSRPVDASLDLGVRR